MQEINLYDEMNQKIDDLLLACEDSPTCMYAGAYIKSLEKRIEEYEELLKDNRY